MNIKFQVIKLKDFYKKNGLIKTIKKLLSKIKNKLFGQCEQKEEEKNYKIWIKENEPNEQELQEQRRYKFEYKPKISVIVPMYNTKEKYLDELIDSLIKQTYENWELCLADGSDKKEKYVERLISQDKRIKYKFLNANKGISENSNCALELATGDYIALLDHDDILPPFSLYEIVKCINNDKEAEFIYTDEDKILEEKEIRLGPHFKPDYAHDTLMSYNYICHFSILKKSLLERIGGFRKEFDGSQDYDLIFRATEQANRVIHIPKILYHWRMNINSVALTASAKPYAYEAAKRAISSHLDRIGVEAKVEDGAILGMYRVNYKVSGNPKVSIIIPNKDHKNDLEKCINSILEKTTYENYEIVIVENNSQTNEIFKFYKELEKNKKIKIVKYDEEGFNYSKINNFGVKKSEGDYIVLLNNDTEIITNDWLETMLGNCQREDVGIVGAKLLYKDLKVQHAGVVLGMTGVAGHVNLGANLEEPGYMSRNVIIQNYSAVTGAMMMISKKDFLDVGGLDEEFPIAYNDIDLCLKIREKNKLVVMNPYAQAYHYESKTRGYDNKEKEKIRRLEEESAKLKEKWKEVFEKEDPYFNKNFRHDTVKMKIKVNNEKSYKKNNNDSKKSIWKAILAIIVTMMFFTYEAVITFDSSHYLWLTSLISRSSNFSTWDVARGPIFPLFIRICQLLFGKNVNGLLIGMFAFYILMLFGCYLIYKDTIKNEKYISKKIKILFGILFFLLIAINPMIFGYYHTVLTECIAITLAVISCYMSWKWIEINFYENKLKYAIYTVIFAIMTSIAWLLKQPYVGTVIFPVIIASIISFVRKRNIKNFLQRLMTLIICIVVLIISLNIWNGILKNESVEIKENRTSGSFLSSGIISGITEYSVQNIKNFDTIEEVEECNRISEQDKEKIYDIIEERSQYKGFKVVDVNEEEYKIIYSKEESISLTEAIKFWIETFKKDPKIIIKSYITNYFATTSLYNIDFEGMSISISKGIDFLNTKEIDEIGFKIYEYGNSNVFSLDGNTENLEQYVAEYESVNEPILAINWIMQKLQIPVTIVMKISYILLPILTILSIIVVFRTNKKYEKEYQRIIDIITILFTYSILHVLVHALLGSTIDRYIMPTMVTVYIGIILSIYAIINRKKYKINNK